MVLAWLLDDFEEIHLVHGQRRSHGKQVGAAKLHLESNPGILHYR